VNQPRNTGKQIIDSNINTTHKRFMYMLIRNGTLWTSECKVVGNISNDTACKPGHTIKEEITENQY